eukprot:1141507-Pelagomonas_calceolata.AAC.8
MATPLLLKRAGPAQHAQHAQFDRAAGGFGPFFGDHKTEPDRCSGGDWAAPGGNLWPEARGCCACSCAAAGYAP